MLASRREFLEALLSFAPLTWASSRGAAAQPAPTMLILGGTSFVGPAIVNEALRRGYIVTLFNRGITNPHLFPQLEKLRGDRNPDVGSGLRALRGRKWDVVVDTSGYFPRHVRASAELLRASASHYVYISSIAVYADYNKVSLDETDAVRVHNGPIPEVEEGRTYGARKAACEAAVADVFRDRYTTFRCHAIVGPGDPDDFFRYWSMRVARGGEVLAPGDGKDFVQYTEVRDLARWTLEALSRKLVGTFNALGPASPLTFAEFLRDIHSVLKSDVKFTWVSEAFLREQGVGSWGDMPLWSRRSSGGGFTQISNAKLRAAGLGFGDFQDLVQRDVAWSRANLPANYEFGMNGGGIPRAHEAALLSAWHRSRVPSLAR